MDELKPSKNLIQHSQDSYFALVYLSFSHMQSRDRVYHDEKYRQSPVLFPFLYPTASEDSHVVFVSPYLYRNS